MESAGRNDTNRRQQDRFPNLSPEEDIGFSHVGLRDNRPDQSISQH